MQSLQILLASGVVNRDISAVQFGQIPFRVGVMLVMITENPLQICTPIEYSLTEHHFHKKPLIQRVSKGGPLQFGCWAMVGWWVGPLTHLAPFYGHGKQIRGKVKTALDILCFILS